MIIQDRDGKIIFGEQDGDVAKLSFAAPEALQEKVQTSPLFDFALVTLSRPLGSQLPLKINFDNLPEAGAKTFSVGYPAKTYDRKSKLGQPDSDGVSQYCTFGVALTPNDYLVRSNKNSKVISPEVIDILNQAHLFSDDDSYFGMSGAPTFNKKGEVVGLVLGAYPVDAAASASSVVLSIRVSWIRGLLSREKP